MLGIASFHCLCPEPDNLTLFVPEAKQSLDKNVISCHVHMFVLLLVILGQSLTIKYLNDNCILKIFIYKIIL